VSELWFTADPHFGHANIITFCNRPFADVTEMNEALVARWNSRVSDGDMVVVVGDVMMGLVEDAAPYLARLNGRKLLVIGNHDSRPRRAFMRSLGWRGVGHLLVNDVLIQHKYVEGDHDYETVIHGHAHGSVTLPRHHDVGVDVHGWDLDAGYAGRPVPAPYVLSRRDEFALRRMLEVLF
jgi:calcineurin-like phosphoesterase family protein